MKEKMKLLFICGSNSCRSAMAEFITNTKYGDVAEALSAGVDGNSERYGINTKTREIMKSMDIDISTHKPRSLVKMEGDFYIAISFTNSEPMEFFDKNYPNIHAEKLMYVPVDDPKHKKMEKYQVVVAEIEDIIKRILDPTEL
ncbi:hypothetical protein COB64_04475 [Candidatus Wolfebacteria bacterium]|nr:MAG: hypothetical protein COB64_04475 [Candidatus Wolfebacteria bacterium]